MYWYCSLCMEWRADTYIKIDPRTRSPMCKVCGQWVRDNLSDGDTNVCGRRMAWMCHHHSC